MTRHGPPGVPLFTQSEQVGTEVPPGRVRLIIAGSRGLAPSVDRISQVIAGWLPATSTVVEVVSGHARGVDRCGERWANHCRVPVRSFPARWSSHGPGAPFIRNAEMVAYADALLAIWDGASRGTYDVITRMRKHGKPTRIVIEETRHGLV